MKERGALDGHGAGKDYVDVPKPDESELHDGQAKKPYEEMLRVERAQGLLELRRPIQGLGLSGLSAGLDIGFSAFFMAVMWTLVHDEMSHAATRLLVSAVYPLGFIFVVLGRSELFTEHTTLAVIPVLDKKAPARALARLWSVIYVGNLVGAALVAGLIAWGAPRLEAIDPNALLAIARPLVEQEPEVMFVGAVLAGWLMGLLSWLVTAGKDTTSQLLVIYIITAGIGLAHLPHCIVGSVEVLAAVFTGRGPGFGDYAYFLLWATLGNAVGGSVFVAGLKFLHVRYHS